MKGHHITVMSNATKTENKESLKNSKILPPLFSRKIILGEGQ